MNQDVIEKNYYESLMAGHYIDVRYSDQEWKMAKIIERDKRYAVIVFDATNNKEEVISYQFSKFYCKVSKWPLSGCSLRVTLATHIEPVDLIFSQFHNIKQYKKHNTAFRNITTNLRERYNPQRIHHYAIFKRIIICSCPFFALKG